MFQVKDKPFELKCREKVEPHKRRLSLTFRPVNFLASFGIGFTLVDIEDCRIGELDTDHARAGLASQNFRKNKSALAASE